MEENCVKIKIIYNSYAANMRKETKIEEYTAVEGQYYYAIK